MGSWHVLMPRKSSEDDKSEHRWDLLGRWPWGSIFRGLGWDPLHPCGVLSILLERGRRGVNVGTALTSDCTTAIRQTRNSSSSQSWNFASTILPFIPAFNAAASEFQVRKWEKKGGLYWVAVEKTLRCLRFRYKTWILCSSLSLSECFSLCLCLVNAWSIDFLPVWTGFPASLFVLVFSTLW